MTVESLAKGESLKREIEKTSNLLWVIKNEPRNIGLYVETDSKNDYGRTYFKECFPEINQYLQPLVEEKLKGLKKRFEDL